MEGQDPVASFGVERAPLFVRHGEVRQSSTEFEWEAPLCVAEEVDEAAPARRSKPGLPQSRAGFL